MTAGLDTNSFDHMEGYVMKKKGILLLILFICLLSGCGSGAKLPDNPIRYEQGINEEEGYAYLEYGDKRFIPYCAYEKKYLGDCIGYCDIFAVEYTDVSRADRVYVFEMKGYSSDEWIIEMQGLDNCNEGMILREINTEIIPEGMTSEYKWNP